MQPDTLPRTYDNPFKIIALYKVAKKIRDSKKPKSAVEGDALPSLANTYSDYTAIPATRIFNYALQSKSWPLLWRTTTQNAILKTDAADKFDRLRNLSCTNHLSKILE